MFDYPLPESCLFHEFLGDVNTTGAGTNIVRPLHIPNGVSMLYALLIGPGGAGGNGFSGAAGTTRGGGGGGGSGAITRILIPAKLLPPTIYVLPGQGGTNFAGSGVASRLLMWPGNGTAQGTEDIIAIATQGGPGGNGSGAGGGSAGTAGAVMANNSGTFANLGLWVSVAGQAGIVGGSHTGAAGGTVTWGTGGLPTAAGAAGGGTGTANTNFAGGGSTGNVNTSRWPAMPTIAGGVAAAGDGNNGSSFRYGRWPIRGCGGTGGGTAGAAGTGGRGGDGGIGSGGGGGGGGVTGGAGGNGGPGWIGIWMW